MTTPAAEALAEALPPLPDVQLAEIRNDNVGETALSETGAAYYGSNWREVRKLYTADQMHAYARAALAQAEAKPAPALSNPVTVYTNRGAAPAAPAEPVAHDLKDLVQQALAAVAQAEAKPTPAGFVLVPVEPTPEMLKAADAGDDAYTLRNFGPGVQRVMQGPEDHWLAMLAAAPAAPAEPTLEMLKAGAAEWLKYGEREACYPLAQGFDKLTPEDAIRRSRLTHVYRAMLAAAPAAPAPDLKDLEVQQQLAAEWGFVPHPARNNGARCREAFEAVFPMPKNCKWSDTADTYVTLDGHHSIPTWDYVMQFRGWKEAVAACKGEGRRRFIAGRWIEPPAAPAPLTDEQIEAIGHRKAWRYKHSSDPAHSSTYTFNRVCLLDFARAAIEASKGGKP